MQEETIVQIYEEDHGCEGIQSGEIPMDEVLLRDNAGAERWVKLPDAILLAHCLREGDRIVLEKLLQEAQERFPHLK